MENYLVCVLALHKLMQIEQSLMREIIASAHQPRVFELIVRDAMDTIVQDGEVQKLVLLFLFFVITLLQGDSKMFSINERVEFLPQSKTVFLYKHVFERPSILRYKLILKNFCIFVHNF